MSNVSGCIDTDGLFLEWDETSWDSVVFGYPVIRISRLEARGPTAGTDMTAFERARDAIGSRFVSCRLGHEHLRESMLLEDHGFRFIEMTYQPELDDLSAYSGHDEHGLTVIPAEDADIPKLLDIAGCAFRNERIQIDPRLDSRLGDRRYRNWVKASLMHVTQRLYVVRDGQLLVAFFVTEDLGDGTCYWHLNAVAPELQGRGYGFRSWAAMLCHARDHGAQRVRTSIVARNHRVLNLYARMEFRFFPPMMTFHWVRSS